MDACVERVEPTEASRQIRDDAECLLEEDLTCSYPLSRAPSPYFMRAAVATCMRPSTQ